MLGSEDLIRGVLENFETSALPEPEKGLMRFARKITLDLPSMNEADIEELHGRGWDDEAIYCANMVVALVNFQTSGVHPVSDEVHRLHGGWVAQNGYEPSGRVKRKNDAARFYESPSQDMDSRRYDDTSVQSSEDAIQMGLRF